MVAVGKAKIGNVTFSVVDKEAQVNAHADPFSKYGWFRRLRRWRHRFSDRADGGCGVRADAVLHGVGGDAGRREGTEHQPAQQHVGQEKRHADPPIIVAIAADGTVQINGTTYDPPDSRELPETRDQLKEMMELRQPEPGHHHPRTRGPAGVHRARAERGGGGGSEEADIQLRSSVPDCQANKSASFTWRPGTLSQARISLVAQRRFSR